MIRRGQGKARPELPRRAELHVVAPTKDGAEGERLPDGTFAKGNAASRGRGWTQAIRKLLGGADVADAAMRAVANDAWKVNARLLRETPSSGAYVQGLVGVLAQHTAVAAYYAARSLALGLDTEAGAKASELALRHGQRVERLSVTALAVASAQAKATQGTGQLSPEVARRWAALRASRAQEVEPETSAPPAASWPEEEGTVEGPELPADEGDVERVRCDRCDEVILLSAPSCPSCGHVYELVVESSADDGGRCTTCSAAWPAGLPRCPGCGEPEAPAVEAKPARDYCGGCGGERWGRVSNGAIVCVRCGKAAPPSVQHAATLDAAARQAALAEAARTGTQVL